MENLYPINQTQPDLLDGYGVNLIQASAGKRFGNLIVDLISYYVVLIVLGVLYRPFLIVIVTPLLPAIGYALYMSLVELIFKGMTLGKLITGTRAVRDDGSPITANEAFGRGFSRIVPFEAFSAFGGYPWHDRWSHTYVIDVKDSTLP